MKNKELIPKQKELSFLAIVSVGVIAASLLTAAVVWGFLDKPLSTDFHKILITVKGVKERIFPLLIISIFFQTILSIFILVLFALRYSHKISGPMYRVKMLINNFLEGESVEKVFFRQNDFLKPLENDLTKLFKKESMRRELLKKLEKELEFLEKGAATSSDKKNIEDILKRLKELD